VWAVAEREQQLIDGLISTYRELNGKIRRLPDERLGMRSGETGSVRDVLTRLRDHELKFSQALKERVTGVPMPDLFGDVEAPVVGTESSHDSAAVILSQFGTARESTLAMLRSLNSAGWADAPNGGRSIADSVRQLVDNDRRQLERINGLLGAP
jgi:hypothetical protein